MSKTWSKDKLNQIWHFYINNGVKNIWKKNLIDNFNLTEEAPCPICGGKMVKGAYQGVQPKSKHCWNVDHKISVFLGGADDIENLQPMHPWCNNKKGNF